jgi:copper chaperone NosL
MCQPERRRFLGQLAATGFLLTPLAAALSGCNKDNWPDGMAEIKWDRDTCARCSMVISDRRFAVQLRGGPDKAVFKFDDIGCMVFWLNEKADKYPWLADAGTRFWVADFTSKSREEMRWLDAKRAFYMTKNSPMGYNFAAVSTPMPGSLDFTDMRQHTLAKGK